MGLRPSGSRLANGHVSISEEDSQIEGFFS